MGTKDENDPKALRGRWTDWLARWLRGADETPEAGARAQPTTAAAQSMRETVDEPRH